MSVDRDIFHAEILSYSGYVQFFRGLHIRLYVSHRTSKLKLWVVLILLRNSGHGANLRVCMGIFTIRFRRKKFQKFLKNNNIPCVYDVLFIVSLSLFADLRSF